MKALVSLKAVSLLALTLLPFAGAEATNSDVNQSIHGLWRTQAGGSMIELYPCGDRTCGRLVWIKATSNVPPVDRRNRVLVKRGRPLCELAVLGNFKNNGDEWSRGWIYSPDSGSTYEGTLRLQDNDHLVVEGLTHASVTNARIKWTREWTRAEPMVEACRGEAKS